jgi:hypothetical protein
VNRVVYWLFGWAKPKCDICGSYEKVHTEPNDWDRMSHYDMPASWTALCKLHLDERTVKTILELKRLKALNE